MVKDGDFVMLNKENKMMKDEDLLPDEVCLGKHKDTGLWYGLLYVDHPTPRGCHRPIVKLSAKEGKATPQEALDYFLSGLKPEYVKTLLLPNIDE
jgi:hypothetical protein